MIEYHLSLRDNIFAITKYDNKVRQNISCIIHMERYRSGHNEAVLKTVCPQGRVGSNPTLSVGRFLAANNIRESANCRSTQAAEGAPLERE